VKKIARISDWFTPKIQELRRLRYGKKRNQLRDRTNEPRAKRNMSIAKVVDQVRDYMEREGLLCPPKRCAKCGSDENTLCVGGQRIPYEDLPFDIDHIDGNCLNDDPSNLQDLCVLCHAKKSRKRSK
jgi:hypothetical protein